jgi:hypothetical protein
LNQAHVSDFFSKVCSNQSEISGQTDSDSPRLVLSGLNDQRHDESLVLIFGQDFTDFLERLSGKDSDLVLFISGPMLQDGDER